MAQATNPKPATPDVVNANENVDVSSTESVNVSGSENTGRYVVKSPWTMSSLTGSNFPTVTPKGTEMSYEEMKAAKAAAKTLRVKLRSTKVSGSDK